MRRDGFFPPGLLVHRLSQGQIRAVSVSTQFCRSRNGSRRGKARRAYACMAKGFDEAWAHFCPSKPCLPLSIDVIIAGSMAGLSGVFLGIKYTAYPTMGNLTNKAFISAVVGGLGSMPGAVVGALILGVLETMISAYVSSALRNLFAYALLIVILLIKPTGLMGKSMEDKA